MKVKKGFLDWPALVLTYIVRLFFWPSAIWITVICIQRGYSLLVMHVIFSTLGGTFLLVEATLAVTGDALLVAKVSRNGRITIHWILHLLGLMCLATGFGFVETHKINTDAVHFTSDHGKLGLTAYIVGFVVAIFAIPTVATKLLPGKISLRIYKYVHIFCGMTALVLLWATQITGLYSNWWQGSDVVTTLAIIGYVIGGFLLLIKPCYNTLSRIFG